MDMDTPPAADVDMNLRTAQSRSLNPCITAGKKGYCVDLSEAWRGNLPVQRRTCVRVTFGILALNNLDRQAELVT